MMRPINTVRNLPQAVTPALFYRGLIGMCIAILVFTLFLAVLFGQQAWVEAQIRTHGRTAPARILRIERDFGGGDGETVSVQYQFTLPSGKPLTDTLHASPKEVEAKLGVTVSFFDFGPRALSIPTTVQYRPDRPEDHRLQGFGGDTSSGSLIGGGLILLAFLAFSGGLLFKIANLRWEDAAPQTVPVKGKEYRASQPSMPSSVGEESGRLPGFTFRWEEGTRFVLRPTWPSLLGPFIAMSIGIGVFSLPALFGAAVMQQAWLGWQGVDIPGSWLTNGGGIPNSQMSHEALTGSMIMGAVLFLFGAFPVFWGLRNLAEVFLHGLRPSLLDRDRGCFRIGGQVVCPLSAIVQLRLRRGYNPENPADAGYHAGFVLRDGRLVPFGLSVSKPTFGKQRKDRDTFLGKEPNGDKIEALMQRAAAFIGAEYMLLHEPDDNLRSGE